MFIAIPTGMNYRTERYPVVTLSLIGLNTLIWLVSLICEICTQGDSQEWVIQYLWLIPSQPYLWTYITGQFVHAGFFHLLGNMLFLFLFGSCVEDMIGRWRFIIFYLVGGLVADLTYIAMSPEHFASDIPMGGASGAISACLGMYLLLRAGANIEFKYFFWFLLIYAGEFEIPAWVAITCWFVKDLFFALLAMVPSTTGHHHGGVAFGAHVGGLLGGLALIALYKWKFRPAEEQLEQAQPVVQAVRADPSVPLLDPATVLARYRPAVATSETPTIFLHDGATQTGPFTLSQVQAGLHDGSISPEMQYWSEGMERWENVKDLSATPM